VVEAALGSLAARGFLFLPHTYGPVTLGIETVDETIVEKLRGAHQPERYATWPARPEVDLISRAPDGSSPVDPAVLERTAAGYRAHGLEVAENRTYPLHPSSLAHRFSFRVPGRALCLELRRDRLVPGFRWNHENAPDPAAVDRLAGPPADAIAAFLATG
jgi:hypothetical protein